MPTRVCSVSFLDYRGTRHTVEVEAESLFEAAALGIQRLKMCDWVEGLGPATRLEVKVSQPTTRHELTVAQVRRWSESAATSPDDRMRRDRVSALIR